VALSPGRISIPGAGSVAMMRPLRTRGGMFGPAGGDAVPGLHFLCRPGAVSAQGDDGDTPAVIGIGEGGDDGTTGGSLQGRAGGVDRVGGAPVDTGGDQPTDRGGAGVAEADDLDGERRADVIG